MRRARIEGWLVRAPGVIERIDACFSGRAYAPHRHDSYAIGLTLRGVQCFDYRRATRHSLPGQVVVLHPDELHDGRAGDGDPFRYRTAYIAPADIQSVLGGRALPFVASGVSNDPRLRRAVAALLDDYIQPLTAPAYEDALFDLATVLERVAGGPKPAISVNRRAAILARDFIDADPAQDFSLGALERVTGRSRWQLSRDFRAVFGTSPQRYSILRRLERGRAMMLRGQPIADAALSCGFADQSHFGRLFKKSFGLTPRAWLGALHDRSIPA